VSTQRGPTRSNHGSPLACPYAGADGEGDGGDGDGLVVPLPTGVGVGEGLLVTDGVGVRVGEGVGVGLVVREGDGEIRDDVVAEDAVPAPETDGVLLDGVADREGRCVAVAAGDVETFGSPPESLLPCWRSATTSVPMTTAATRPTKAIIGSDTDRVRRRGRLTPSLAEPPSSGSGAVGGRW
jgi:hypothetical protein